MSETTERSAYDKLSPQRKQLADMLVANLDSGRLWKQGWRTRGAPENAVTGKKYRGVNNLYLFLVAMERGYSDNRCLPSAIISIPPLAAPSSAGTFLDEDADPLVGTGGDVYLLPICQTHNISRYNPDRNANIGAGMGFYMVTSKEVGAAKLVGYLRASVIAEALAREEELARGD